MRTILSITAAVFVVTNAARADIFQWEYINPADPSQGKQQSTTLAPDGAGVNAVRGADLSGRDLTMAYLIGADLSVAVVDFPREHLESDLAGANLSCADLTHASLRGATLTDADFTRAEIRGAKFEKVLARSAGLPYVFGSGITIAQLYSTASYQAHDMSGIDLTGHDLSGGNFADQNLADAYFSHTTLTGADFSGANLAGTVLYNATLTNADFTGAEVRGASFGKHYPYGGTGITLAQLYSTASYQAHNLSGISLGLNNLAGGNFADQNLTNVDFYGATLTDADFTDAEVRGASFELTEYRDYNYPWPVNYLGTGITLAQLYSTASYQQRDVRGVSGINATIPTTPNLIFPDGHISGLDLDDGVLVVRDYDGDAPKSFRLPIPITIDQHLTMAPGGALRMVFEADAWDSTISFAPGIPVALGGTLELTFADDVNPASQVGRTFDLFDWTGVNPTGAFAIASPYAWDLSNLYTTGQVTLTAIPEPASIALVAAAFSTVMLRRGRWWHKR